MKNILYLMIITLLIATSSAQTFSERHITFTQTEYDLFKTSSLQVTCSDYFCQEPTFILTETSRPLIDDIVIEKAEKLDYVNVCESIKATLAKKELIDWQYADFEKQAEEFQKIDCEKDSLLLKERFDKELLAVPVLTSDKNPPSVSEYPKQAIINLDDFKGKKESVYIPNTMEWVGKIKLIDNQATLKIGGYTNSYNIIVNFSNNQTTCNETFDDDNKSSSYSCGITINKNSSISYVSFNITGLYYNSTYKNAGGATTMSVAEFLGDGFWNPSGDWINISLLKFKSPNSISINNITLSLHDGVESFSNLNCSFNISYNITPCLFNLGIYPPSTTYLSMSNFSHINSSRINGGYYWNTTFNFNLNIPLMKDECYLLKFDTNNNCTNYDSTSNILYINTYAYSGHIAVLDILSGGGVGSYPYSYYWPRIYSNKYGLTSTNVSVDISSNGIIDWNMSGVFNYTNSTAGDFSIALYNCTQNASLCSGDFCTCPLLTTSDSAGIVQFSNLNVTFNTPPIAVNVSITNAPLSAGDTPACGCDCWDYDSAVQNTFIKNYTWYVNGTQIPGNTTTLSNTYCVANANITCGCICYDTFNWGGWANSTTVLVGDTTPPTNTTPPTISNPSPCSTDTSTMTVNVTDTGSNIYLVYAETTLPSGKVNLTMTCTGADLKSQECTYGYSGYSTSILVNRIWMSDVSLNWKSIGVSTSIGFYVCITGGGGGGIPFDDFKVVPRLISGGVEAPEGAYLVGDNTKTYTIIPTGAARDITLSFMNVSVLPQDAVDRVDATGWFHTTPDKSVYDDGRKNVTISCTIPDEFKFDPGVVNSSLVFGNSQREIVHVICESEEHSQRAGAIGLFLSELIPGLNIPVWAFFVFVMVIVIFIGYW